MSSANQRVDMPSPFPGMDPFLEAAHIWPGFHLKLINETVAVLQPQLRERGYYAESGERILLVESGRRILESKKSFAEVYDAARHRLVAVIEFVTPDDKLDSACRDRYVQQQTELRYAGVSL